MNLFPLHKGLLWKEWRQNRWLFWIGLVVLSIPVILYKLMTILSFSSSGIPAEYVAQEWANLTDVGYDVLLGHDGFFPFATIAAMALGGFLLSQERTVANTLDFLVATPVSRREIIAAKYVTGLQMMGIVWGVNLAFVLVMDAIFHSQFSGWLVLEFFCMHGVFLVATYSAGFLAAAYFGNMLSAAIAVITLNVGPFVVGNFLMDLMNRFVLPGTGHDAFYRTFNKVIMALSLVTYSEQRVDQLNGIEVICLFVVAVIFYLLTLFVFERNQMERNGRLLMFGDFWKLAQILVPLGFALIYAFGSNSVDPIQIAIRFVIPFVILFLLVKLVRRLMRNFGFR